MARKQREPETRPALTEGQALALGLLLEGKTPAEVAVEIETPEAEVLEWLSANPFFVAELNRRRLAEYEATAQRVRGLAGAALDRLEALLNCDNEGVALRAAAAILKMNLGDLGKPKGETDPEAVAGDWRQAAAMRGILARW